MNIRKYNEFFEHDNVINLTEEQLEWSATLSESTTGVPGIVWLFEDESKIAISADLSGKDALFIYIDSLEISGKKVDFGDDIIERAINFIGKNSNLIKSHARFDLATDKLIDSIIK